MRERTSIPFAIASLMALLVAACDEDTSSTAADLGSLDTGSGPAAGEFGSATLTIGEETWEFDSFGCAFGHDATQSDVYSFSSNAIGEHSSGARVQMQAEIRDEAGQGRFDGDVIYSIYIQDIDDFVNPSVSWETTNDEDEQLVDLGLAPPSGEAVVSIDGDRVTGEGYFDDKLTDETFERVFGTLTATCGSQSRR